MQAVLVAPFPNDRPRHSQRASGTNVLLGEQILVADKDEGQSPGHLWLLVKSGGVVACDLPCNEQFLILSPLSLPPDYFASVSESAANCSFRYSAMFCA